MAKEYYANNEEKMQKQVRHYTENLQRMKENSEEHCICLSATLIDSSF